MMHLLYWLLLRNKGAMFFVKVIGVAFALIILALLVTWRG